MKKQNRKLNQAGKLLWIMSYDSPLYQAYLGSQRDWAEKLAPNKTGFSVDGSFNGY